MKAKPPAWFLKVRSYKGVKWVSCWIIHREPGGITESFLWGEVMPQVVDMLAEATRLPVEREESGFENVKPINHPRAETVPVDQQANLFQ